MKFFSLLRDKIIQLDLLNTPTSLRVGGSSQYGTVFGGCLSFIIFSLFCSVFITSLLSVINNQSITYSQGISDDVTNSNTISSLQFAVGIDNVDLSINPKKFIFNLEQTSIAASAGSPIPTTSVSMLMLSPCELSDWINIGDHFQEQFLAFGLNKMLCLSPSQAVSLSGYAGSATYQYLTLKIQTCNANDTQCQSTAQISTYMSNFLLTSDYFKVKFYIVDTIISPSNEDAISTILQKNIFAAFTQSTGTDGYINIASYELDTDKSILPFSVTTTQTGSYIEGFQTNSIQLSSTHYIKLNFYKSTKALLISRSIGKIDQVLSYVGGLFGLVFAFISFLIQSYSEIKYEIYVGESVFAYDSSGRKIQEKDFGFFTYLAYSFYDLISCFGVHLKCFPKKFKEITETREEVNQQLDVRLILKRIRHLEKVSSILLTEHKQISLHLAKPATIEDCRKLRKILNYYDTVLDEVQAESHSNQANKKVHPIQENTFQHLEIAQFGQLPEDSFQNSSVSEIINEEQKDQLLSKFMLSSLRKLEQDDSQEAEKIKKLIPFKIKLAMKKEEEELAKLEIKKENSEKTDELMANNL